MGKILNAAATAMLVFTLFIYIFVYNPLNLYETISQNVDYFQFGVLAALFAASIMSMRSGKGK